MSTDEERRRMLYGAIVDEQHRYLDRLQARYSFYTGLLITLIGGCVVAFLQAPQVINFMLMSFGGVLVLLTAWLAKRGIGRTYRLFTECISTRAKLESSFDFDKWRVTDVQSGQNDWLNSEPLVAFRHLEGRKCRGGKSINSSKEYEQALQSKWLNINGITHLTFWVAGTIGVVFLILGITVLIMSSTTATEIVDVLKAVGSP
jgi:hypothetical protein